MKPARFLLIALLYIGIAATCASCAYRTIPEKTVRVSGYVLDAVSRQPVPGVTVEDEGYGHSYADRKTYTDLNGGFELYVPISRREDGWLTCQTALYGGRAAIPADDTAPVTLLLRRNGDWLESYKCPPSADTMHRPPLGKMPIIGYPGSQFAFLVRDSIAHRPYKLRSITFRMGYKGFAREPMRLRIYRYNENLAVPPGEDLLLENFIMCPKSEEDIYTFDVSSFDIIVSGTGFFLALEYVVGGDSFYCNYPVVGYTPTGPVLLPPCARAATRTWEYVIGKGWQRATAFENYWPLYENALSVEVEPVPSPTKSR